MTTRSTPEQAVTLVLAGTGKTGRRVAQQLRSRELSVRVGSRTGRPRFDWLDQSTWAPALTGAGVVYVSYYPDLAAEGAPDAVGAFADLAVASGTRRLVLLSGRGEAEAQRAEQVLQHTGAEWTIVRSSWFCQNFSEGYFLPSLRAGELALPANAVVEPFVDADDIADVAAAALTEDGHTGRLYEVTGPRLLTFAEAVAEIGRAAGWDLRYRPIPLDEFTAGLEQQGVAPDVVGLLRYLFGEVLDGRNAAVTDGVRQALGREPRDFADYAQDAAANGIWEAAS